LKQNILNYLTKSADLIEEIKHPDYLNKVIQIVNRIVRIFNSNGKILLFGNGGSAADCQHIAAEFVVRFKSERNPLPAIALTTDTSILTATANDYDFSQIFSRQIRALGTKADIAIAISTSGRSKNVIEAIKTAKQNGLATVSLTGKSGNELAKLTDIAIIVPSEDTALIQQIHITIAHIICQLVEEFFINHG
jgi:D-sedoheptulose 7-phosphate isomerase